ncbi:MAG: hypothetical protein ACXVPQ_02285 [Bacteroidia bacterium]
MSNSLFISIILPRYFAGAVNCVFSPGSYSSLAFKKLCSTSFESQEKHRYSYRSVISGIKRLSGYPVLKEVQKITGTQFIYDVDPGSGPARIKFLEFNGIAADFEMLSPPALLYYNSKADKLLFFICTLPVQLHILVYGLFKKDRSGLNALLKNLLLTRNFLSLNIDFKKSHFFFFSIYDTNSAFLSNCLMRKGAFVSQVASEVPLYKWNRIIITNELILCSDYQRVELDTFKDTINYQSVKLSGPETFYKIAKLYTQEQPKNNSLGFYSTGGWVRKKLGHVDQGNDMELHESKILADLAEILHGSGMPKLVIYPHPREWSYYDHSEAALREHYQKLIPGISFTLQKPGTPTNELFDEVYLAVCYMTTVIFERAHAKRKSVIAYFQEPGFPLVKSAGHLHMVSDKKELEDIIRSAYN